MDPTLDPEVIKLGESKEPTHKPKVISKYSKNPAAMGRRNDLDLEKAEPIITSGKASAPKVKIENTEVKNSENSVKKREEKKVELTLDPDIRKLGQAQEKHKTLQAQSCEVKADDERNLNLDPEIIKQEKVQELSPKIQSSSSDNTEAMTKDNNEKEEIEKTNLILDPETMKLKQAQAGSSRTSNYTDQASNDVTLDPEIMHVDVQIGEEDCEEVAPPAATRGQPAAESNSDNVTMDLEHKIQ